MSSGVLNNGVLLNCYIILLIYNLYFIEGAVSFGWPRKYSGLFSIECHFSLLKLVVSNYRDYGPVNSDELGMRKLESVDGPNSKMVCWGLWWRYESWIGSDQSSADRKIYVGHELGKCRTLEVWHTCLPNSVIVDEERILAKIWVSSVRYYQRRHPRILRFPSGIQGPIIDLMMPDDARADPFLMFQVNFWK